MAWTRDSTTGALTHSGTSREFWMIGEGAPSRAEFRAGCTAVAGNVKVAVRTSADGATCFEVGIDGANLVIRQRGFGAEVPPVISTPHGIAASTPFTIRVVLDGDAITVYAGVSAASEVSCTLSSATLKRYSGRYGVVSDQDGAVVSWFEVGEITDRILTLSEIGVMVAGGGVYRSVNDGQWELVQANVFPPTVRVAMASLNGEMFMVGGGLARVYRPITNTVALWEPTAGTLPGQTGPGTTTATLLEEHMGGLVLGGMPSESITIYGTKLNDAYNLQTSTGVFGAAYVIGVGNNATVGDPIVAFEKGPELFIACRNSTNFMVGDPYRGTHQVVTRSLTVGASGPDSVMRGSGQGGEPVLIMHAAEGVQRCVPGGAPVDISSPILKRHLSFPKSEACTVVIERDPSRQWFHVFIDRDGADSVHLIYDETRGGYRPGGPGWYPIQIPVRISAAVVIRGRLLLGTTDGRLVRFSQVTAGTTTATELGSNIESRVTMALVDLPGSANDTRLTKPRIVLGLNSATVTLTLYGGVTAEAAYKVDERVQLAHESFVARQFVGTIEARAPFLAAVLTTDGTRLIFEEMQAVLTTAAMSTSLGWVERPAAPALCTSPASTSLPAAPAPPTPPGGPSGPGGGGGGGTFVPDMEEEEALLDEYEQLVDQYQIEYGGAVVSGTFSSVPSIIVAPGGAM